MKSTTGARHEFARRQQAPGVTQDAELQREAQLVARPAPGGDVLQILVAQRVVAQQLRLVLWQREDSRPLPAGQNRPARHLFFLQPGVWKRRIRNGIRCTETRHRHQRNAFVPNPRLRQMLIGYTRVSKADGSQSLDLQRDALIAAGVDPHNVYDDFASGVRDDRPGLENCLRALRKGDVLVVWKLDRLGRNLTHLVNTVQNLAARGVGLRVLTGQGAQIDTTTAAGRLVFGIFAALAEFEGELIRERTVAGLKAARARGRKGGGGGGSSRCRKLRSVWHRPPWRTATRLCRN